MLRTAINGSLLSAAHCLVKRSAERKADVHRRLRTLRLEALEERALLAAELQVDTPPSEDTTLAFSTLLGGTGFDRAQGVFVDDQGFIYLAGNTDSLDFPATPGAFDQTQNGFDGTVHSQDGFVAKLSPDGSRLLWATYLGGSRRDQVYGVRVDDQGFVYAVGWTVSSDFPTTSGVFSESSLGGHDVFVAKLTPDGSALVYSTYVGGTLNERSRGDMFLASDGSIYISGITYSSDFPTSPGAFQTSFQGGASDAFVFHLSSDGSQLIRSTYLGGSSNESALSGVFLVDNGDVIVAGGTTSDDFPVTSGAFQTIYAGGVGTDTGFFGDGYVVRLRDDLSDVVYATYLGGGRSDFPIHNQGLAVDSQGRAIVTGLTDSADFPIPAGAFQPHHSGGLDGFVARLSADGSKLEAATYVGGTAEEEPSGIVVTEDGSIIIGGKTASPNYPTTTNAAQATYGGGNYDLVFTKFTTDLSAVAYSTFLGGSGTAGFGDRGRGLWLDPFGGVLVSGDTNSADFPTTAGAWQTQFAGGDHDAVIVRFAPTALLPDAVAFAARTFSAFENAGLARIAVTRSGNGTGSLGVDYSITGGTAIDGSDYTLAARTLVWGERDLSTKVITIPLVDDDSAEGQEFIELALNGLTGPGRLSNSRTVLTVIDDDADLTGSLLAHWPLDDTQGAIATDLSGAGNDGTLVGGAQWTTGRRSGAIDLDGADDFIAIPDSPNLQFDQAITIAAWIQSDRVASAGTVLSQGDDVQLRVFPDKLRFRISVDTGTELQSAFNFVNATWYHLVGTYDGRVMRLFVDGIEIGAVQAVGIPLNASGADWAIGRRSGTNAANLFDGRIDDVRIYGRALSADEIHLLAKDEPQRASLGDLVWLDVNRDGIQQPNEPGMANVLVELIDPVDGIIGNRDDMVVDTRTTDAAGTYRFSSIAPRDYYLHIQTPVGLAFTNVNAGGNAALDSDATVMGWMGPIRLSPGQVLPGLDAGLISAKVVGRHLFYNGSALDGNDPAANAADDAAIAPDPTELAASGFDVSLGKSALLPGQTASFANYSSFASGLTGVMIDVMNLANPDGISAADFTFTTGNDGAPDTWRAANSPLSVNVRKRAGVNGADRISVAWHADNGDGVVDPHEAVKGAWLGVRLLANQVTGLSEDEWHAWGNAPGEVGNDPNNAVVNVLDAIQDFNEFGSAGRPHNPFDHNRDGTVNVLDALLSFRNQSAGILALRLIDLSTVDPTAQTIKASPASDTAQPLNALLSIFAVIENEDHEEENQLLTMLAANAVRN